MIRLPPWVLSHMKRPAHQQYESLADEGGFEFAKDKQRPWRIYRLLNRSRVAILAAFLIASSVLYFSTTQSSTYHDWAPASERSSYLHVVVPASKSDINLCKTLYSAAILDYPTPILINWDKKFDNKNILFDGSHIAKIAGVLEYLRSLPESSDDDLVLVIDAYDVWFQLRPSVLIQRYLDVNARANRRISRQLGRAMEREGIQQTVVFSSQKKCWPEDLYNPRCYTLPEPTLDAHVYGPATDTEEADPDHQFRRFRQRYLNSGAVIGPRKQLLAVFERAVQRTTRDEHLFSDQGIFAEMLGEQEFQREVLRLRHRGWGAWLSDAWGRFRGTYHSFTEDENADMAPAQGAPFEFGIGLDYASELSQPTVFADLDTAWLMRNDSAAIAKASLEQAISPPSVGPLSQDILSSKKPFALSSPGLPSPNTSWKEVPLFTNLFTGVNPVAVHHNAWRNGLKERRQTQWNMTWFQPYARELLGAQLHDTVHPVAEAAVNGTVAHEWFGSSRTQNGVDIFGAKALAWEDLCKGSEDEIFRDGHGPWNASDT